MTIESILVSSRPCDSTAATIRASGLTEVGQGGGDHLAVQRALSWIRHFGARTPLGVSDLTVHEQKLLVSGLTEMERGAERSEGGAKFPEDDVFCQPSSDYIVRPFFLYWFPFKTS
eukprot:3423367-Rhodomonas_salina.2